MIDSQKILYDKEAKMVECYTPRYAVEAILNYIPAGIRTIWCPCDIEESEYVKVFRENGYKVIASHISNGQDFLTYEPTEKWDCLITNPPFKGKRSFFERALSFNKPFAMLAPMTWFNDSAIPTLFAEKDLQILGFNKRIKFYRNGIMDNKITFASAYLCWNFLPKQIVWEKIEDK